MTSTSRHSERMAEWILAAVHKLRSLQEDQDKTIVWSDEEFAKKIGLMGPQSGWSDSWHTPKIVFILKTVDAIAKESGQVLPTHRVITRQPQPHPKPTAAAISAALCPP
jgi:hypothetical protein